MGVQIAKFYVNALFAIFAKAFFIFGGICSQPILKGGVLQPGNYVNVA